MTSSTVRAAKFSARTDFFRQIFRRGCEISGATPSCRPTPPKGRFANRFAKKCRFGPSEGPCRKKNRSRGNPSQSALGTPFRGLSQALRRTVRVRVSHAITSRRENVPANKPANLLHPLASRIFQMHRKKSSITSQEEAKHAPRRRKKRPTAGEDERPGRFYRSM